MPLEGDVHLVVESLKNLEDGKKRREDDLYLKNFSADRVFEVHGLSGDMKFFDLRKIISPFIWSSSAKKEVDVKVVGEKDAHNSVKTEENNENNNQMVQDGSKNDESKAKITKTVENFVNKKN